VRKARVYERLVHLLSSDAPAAAVDRTLDIALDAVPAEAASLMTLDEKAGELVVVCARGPVAAKVRGLRIEVGAGIAGVAAMFRTSVAVPDVSRDARFHREAAASLGFPTRSVLAVPLLRKSKSIGVLEVLNRRGGDEFSPDDIEVLEKVALAAAAVLALRGTE
jgi:GAF domain-containing protein